jgi:predicted NAD-dependent protein-ADP-ribosyltransferase YbiA (DUF1768 family)
LNLLGKALMETRERLLTEEAGNKNSSKAWKRANPSVIFDRDWNNLRQHFLFWYPILK